MTALFSPASSPTPAAMNLLELRGVTVSFDGFLALNDLNLQLAPGELRAVIGPNGAGKTTFLDVITGKVKPTKGDVVFRGRSIAGRSEHQISRLGIGRKFQTPRVYQNLSPRRNLELAVRGPHRPCALLFGALSADQRDRVQHLLGVVGLERQAQQPAGASSSDGRRRNSSRPAASNASSGDPAASSVTMNSPVLMSAAAIPARLPSTTTAAMKLFDRASSIAGSTTVPGVTTRVTSRSTIPRPFWTSPTCSQIATL